MRATEDDFQECVAESLVFKGVLETVKLVAPRKCTVVVCGESGTGKELVAHLIHRLSGRSRGPFVPVDCTNLSGELFASQLFGHVRGAFTGADRDTLGFFRAADAGTIFLDEISELSASVQARLLRVLQESVVVPVGATASFKVDVRVICATNRNLEQMVAEGLFRKDLYYRMNVVNVHIPPLREHRADIIPLAKHFLRQQADLYDEPIKELADETKRSLLRYDWPGNVRELANAMEHAYVLSPEETVRPSILPPEIAAGQVQRNRAPFPTLAQANRELLTRALRYTAGRKLPAARLLGVERRRFDRLIRNLGMDPKKMRS